MGDFAISPGQKFAIVAIPGAMTDGSSSPFPLRLADDLWALRELPVSLAKHWHEWIGSTRASEIEKASLLLVAKMPSAEPRVLDGDSKKVEQRITSFYWSTLAVAPLVCKSAPTLVGGGCHEDSCDVRQVGWLPQPYYSMGVVTYPVDGNWLREGAAIAISIDLLQQGRFRRINRALNAFYTAITTQNLTERLHQFTRCIEGFALGGTANHFATRTELFVGPGRYDLMYNLYNLRSKVEHLNDLDPLLGGETDQQRNTAFMKAVVTSEFIARHCVRRFLSDDRLWPSFKDQDSQAVFWKNGNEVNRRAAWGAPFDLTALLSRISEFESPP